MTETLPAQSLVGTHCASCDRSFFPARDLCPTCWAPGLPSRDIVRTGTVATWTVVRMGKLFEVPYAICYADFEPDVRVLGRVVNWNEDRPLRPGMTVTTHATNHTGEDGRVVTTEHVFTVDHSSAPVGPEA